MSDCGPNSEPEPRQSLCGWAGDGAQAGARLRRLAGRAVLDPVLVDVHEVEDLGLAGGGAGQQAVAALSHQPLVGVGVHVPAHVLLHPGVHPGLEALVQPRAHPLMGLREEEDT